MSKNVLTAAEIKEWLLENCLNERGDLWLKGLDFSDFDGDIFIFNWRVKRNLNQYQHDVGGDLYQSHHKVGGDLNQSYHKVAGDLNQRSHEVAGDLRQHSHEVKGLIK